MVIILKQNANKDSVERLRSVLGNYDVKINEITGAQKNIMGLVGDTSHIDIESILAQDCVENVQRVQEPYKNVNRKFHPENTVVDCGGVKVGVKMLMQSLRVFSITGTARAMQTSISPSL